jgi:hypothetical protein
MDGFPTKDDIKQLPRWAQVAYAARCARLVLPLFKENWPDAPKERVVAVEKAVEIAEQSAAAAAYAAFAAATADAAAAAAAAAAFAAVTAAAAADAYAADAYAAAAAADAADAAEKSKRLDLIPQMKMDFQTLLRLAKEQRWNDDTPVPPTVFETTNVEKPKTIAPVESLESKLRITIVPKPGADHDEIGRRLIELYRSLNDYSLLKYGKGLTIGEFEQYINTRELVPEGVS